MCLLSLYSPILVVREVEPAENHLKDMLQQLVSVMAAKPSEKATVCQGERGSRSAPPPVRSVVFILLLSPFAEEAEDPACVPIFWISKWVDYSDKYGLGECWSGPAARPTATDLPCF